MPDMKSVDSKGCANALAKDRSATSGATTFNTNLVEIVPHVAE
jgi:hypothetical protein